MKLKANLFLLVPFFLLVYQFSYSQIRDTTEGINLLRTGNALFDSAQYELAGLMFHQAMDQFMYSQSWEHYSDAVESYATCFYAVGDFEKAKQALIKGIQICEEQLGKEDFSVGTLYNAIGGVYYSLGKCHKAYPYLQKAVAIMEKNNLRPSSLGTAYNNLATCADIVEGLEESLEYYDKALSIYLDVYEETHEKVAMACSNIGWTYGALGDFDKQYFYYNKSLQIRKKLYGASHVKVVGSYINMGAFLYKMGNYARTLEFNQKALHIIEEAGLVKHPYLTTIYLNLAAYYWAIKDHETATEYYLKAARDDIHNLGRYHPNLMATYFNLSHNYVELKDLDRAWEYFLKGREVFLKSKNGSRLEMANGFGAAGYLFLKKKDYRKAIEYFNRGLAIYKRESHENHPQIINYITEIASAHGKLGEPDIQLKLYYEALKLHLLGQSINYPTTGIIFSNLAHYYQENNNRDSANHYLQKALGTIYESNDVKDFESIPKWENIFFPEELMVLLKLKGNIYLTENVDDLSVSLASFEIAANTIDSIRFNQISFTGKQDLASEAISIYEGGIKASLKLYELTGEDKYYESAFRFAEKGKATLLYQAIQKAEARVSAGLPDSVYSAEEKIKLSLNFYKKKILEEEAKGEKARDDRISKWQKRVFELIQQKDSLIETLERRYPKYYELKYNENITKVADIQSFLIDKESELAAYFDGDENIYLFHLSGKQKAIYTIPKDFPLRNWTEKFCRSIYAPFTIQAGEDSVQIWADDYQKLGHMLYKKILPFRTEESQNEKLIIIPDGQLGYIPFDALLTEVPSSPGKYRFYPYLAKKAELSYAYSVNVLIHQYEPRVVPLPKKQLAAFSPSFGEGIDTSSFALRGNLAPLAFSKPEVMAISKYLESDLFLDEEATVRSFIHSASEYQLIHISSHAMVNDKLPLYSQIAFSVGEETLQDTTDDGFLDLGELFHLNLPAEMVVLSACETGIGRYYRGEGISSLARGFSYAGARSIVTTLWKVNDEATSQIMEKFYQNLDDKLPKDEALRKAKLSYIDGADNLTSHPFYWAGYIPIGNMEMLDNEGFNWWCILVFIGFLGIVGIWRWKS